MKRIALFRLVTLGMLIVGMVLFSGQVWAQFGDQGQQLPQREIPRVKDRERVPDMGEDGIKLNWRALKLTPEQQEQMQQLRREFQINTAGIRQELGFIQQDLRTEMIKEPVDQAKIDSLLNDISGLKQRLNEAAVQNLLDIKGLLTQEQLQKLADFQQPLPPELRKIQLTQKQKSTIRELMKSSRQQNKQLFEDLAELRENLRELLLSADEVDQVQLKQLQTDIAEKELALETARVKGLLELRNVLTPEQREKLVKFRSVRQKKMK